MIKLLSKQNGIFLLLHVLYSEDQVFNLIAGLDCSTAIGVDNISARMLKATVVDSIVSSLTVLFKLIDQNWCFPTFLEMCKSGTYSQKW